MPIYGTPARPYKAERRVYCDFARLTGSPFETRNRGLFMLGVSTGERISELRNLTWQNGGAVTDLPYEKNGDSHGEEKIMTRAHIGE